MDGWSPFLIRKENSHEVPQYCAINYSSALRFREEISVFYAGTVCDFYY
jgi:hypothetical protein